MSKLHRSQLLAEIKQSFPELTPELNAEEGLLAFELEVFCKFTMHMIGSENREAVATCYALMDKYYAGGNDKLRDAIDTCYVENLEFPTTKHKDRAWAWEILPDRLKALYQAFHGS